MLKYYIIFYLNFKILVKILTRTIVMLFIQNSTIFLAKIKDFQTMISIIIWEYFDLNPKTKDYEI